MQIKTSDRKGQFWINSLSSILQADGNFSGMSAISLIKTDIGKRPIATLLKDHQHSYILENPLEINKDYAHCSQFTVTGYVLI